MHMHLSFFPPPLSRCYAQVLELARVMFLKCHLVHADLSEYNVLYHEKVCMYYKSLFFALI